MRITCPCCGAEYEYNQLKRKKIVDLKVIARMTVALSRATNYSINMICSKCRKRSVVDVRCCVAKILSEDGFSSNKIGEYINRDHATVIALVKRFIDQRKYVQKIYDALRKELDFLANNE